MTTVNQDAPQQQTTPPASDPPPRGGGPKTDAGKENSRANSTTHGLSGNGDVLEPDDEKSIDKKYREICQVRKPTNPLQCFIILRIAVCLTLLRKSERQLSTCYANAAFWAQADWPALRRLLVATLLEGLSARPGTVSQKLQRSPQGCRALIDEWDALEGFLHQHGCWTKPQRSWALDLLGVGKLRRDSGRTELDPRPGDGTTELSRAQEVVRRELKRLRTLADSPVLQEFDARERDQIIEHRQRPDTNEARLAERYRGEHARRAQWYWRVLDKLQKLPAGFGMRPGTPQDSHAEVVKGQDQAEATMRLLQEAGVLKEGADLPSWAVPTTPEIAKAEALFRQYQAETKAAATKTVGSAGALPSRKPGVNGIPVAAAAQPAVDAQTGKPLTRAQRRKLELRERAQAKAQNGAPRH